MCLYRWLWEVSEDGPNDSGFIYNSTVPKASGAFSTDGVSTLALLKILGKEEVIFLSCHSVNIVDSSSNEGYFNGTLTKLLSLLPGRNSVTSV